eukprot:SAG11_NODE_26354_length_346_cov_0.866397_1_plen_115_part_11
MRCTTIKATSILKIYVIAKAAIRAIACIARASSAPRRPLTPRGWVGARGAARRDYSGADRAAWGCCTTFGHCVLHVCPVEQRVCGVVDCLRLTIGVKNEKKSLELILEDNDNMFD